MADAAALALALAGVWTFLLGHPTAGVLCVWAASYGYLWLGVRATIARLGTGARLRPGAAMLALLRSAVARSSATARTRRTGESRPPLAHRGGAVAMAPSSQAAASAPVEAAAPPSGAAEERVATAGESAGGSSDDLEKEILAFLDRSDLARQAYRYHYAIVSSIPIAAWLGHWHRGLAAAALFVSLLAIVSSFVYRHGAIVTLGLGPKRFRWRCHFLIAFGFYFSTTALKPLPSSVVTDALGSAILALPPALITSAIVRRIAPRRLPERLARWPIAVAIAIYLLGLL